MAILKIKNGNHSSGKARADIRTVQDSQADTANHFFDDGKAVEGGLVVPIGLYNSVKFQSIAILDYLSADAEYDAEALYGAQHWDQLQPYEQRLVDACLKTLIADGDVPLEVADPSCAYPVRYRLDLNHETLVSRFTEGHAD